MTRAHISPLGLATLAALGLAVAPSARAQSLTLKGNDTVTVSSAGTVGTVGGAPVANTTTSYNDSDNFYAVETNDTATFILSSGGTLTATKQN